MLSDSRTLFADYTDEATFQRIREYETLCEMWESCVKEYGSRVAVMDDGKEYTYEEIEKKAAAQRYRILQEQNSGKGVRIGVYAKNSIDFVVAFLAVTTSGNTAVVIPPQLDDKTVYGCSLKYGISAFLAEREKEETLALLAKMRPEVKLWYTDEETNGASEAAETTGNAPCVVMFTGGTTGRSKGALLSHEAVMQGVVNGCYGYRDVFGQRYLLVLPLSHVFGLIRNLLTSLYTGSTLFICRNNQDMFRDIAVFRPTVLVLVPALAEMALNLSKKFGRNMLGQDMKYIICGAAAVAPYLMKEYKAMGIDLFPGYGLTESANLISGNPKPLEKPESVGIPYPNQQLKVVDGELWFKGKNRMDGYLGEEEINPFEDGWFKTGDLARFDNDGFLYITGRIKEIIVLPNGENVSPAEVEAFFNALDCIQDSQVFEDRNAQGTSILALEVVPRMTEVAKLATEDPKEYILKKLKEVNDSLPGYQKVSKMTIRESDFARTPSMKIVRYQNDKK